MNCLLVFDAKTLNIQITNEDNPTLLRHVFNALTKLAHEYVSYVNPPPRDMFLENHFDDVYLDMVVVDGHYNGHDRTGVNLITTEGDVISMRWRFTELLSACIDAYFDQLVGSIRNLRANDQHYVANIHVARFSPHQLTLLAETRPLHGHHRKHAAPHSGGTPGWP